LSYSILSTKAKAKILLQAKRQRARNTIELAEDNRLILWERLSGTLCAT